MSLSVLAIYGLVMGSAALLTIGLVPLATEQFQRLMRRRVSRATAQLSGMFLEIPVAKLLLFYALVPAVLGLGCWLIVGKPVAAAVGAALGIVVPEFLLKHVRRQRHRKFNDQLVDGLMILSSSLKAGLSILQAIEILVEEMPPPMSQEFGLVIKENKMGMPLNESLERLKKRMVSDELGLVITAILVARETGGDVTEVFGKLIETIRERKKIREKVKTLVVQGKLQGIIMSGLPVGFAAMTYTTNRHYFDPFFNDPLGRMLIAAVVVMEAVGALLILKFSRVRI
ncbi:MAG: type II secretion system F family protein [Candidatus Omnitrophica bacterium]|nr:type II secretion system F family protein [Candidatus Omnitrophota bacterium]